TLAQDLGDAVRLDELRQLRDRDALAAGRADGEVPETGDRVAVLDQPHRDVEAPLTLVELGDHPALGRGLDHVLDVLDVDAVAGGRGAVHNDLQLRKAGQMVPVEIGYTRHVAQHLHDLPRRGVHHEDVGPVEFDGQPALYP